MLNGVFRIPVAGTSGSGPNGVKSAAHGGFGLKDFVAGPENRLAALAVQSWLERPAAAYTPLVLYGPAGTGKSHLARGLARQWRRTHRAAKVICTSGAEYAQKFAAAVAGDWVENWRAEHRNSSLFVLDDIGQLAGKRVAQQELCRTLDELLQRDALVLVTDRSLAGHLPGLTPALRSRLSGGLAVPLALPGIAARRVILDELASARGMTLPSRAVQLLADGLEVPVPALAAALDELEVASRREGLAIDADFVRHYVAGRALAMSPTIQRIAAITARYYGLKLSDLKSPLRQQQLVAARGVAIYLARTLTDRSLQQIGTYFGGRDHTTVLHGFRRTDKLVKHDPALRQAVCDLRSVLTPS